MAERTDGGAAFPGISGSQAGVDSYNTPYTRIEASDGMSLRDWFAGQALMGICASLEQPARKVLSESWREANTEARIDAHELLAIAGFAAWRTRLSELRKPPYNMRIENWTRRVATPERAQRHVTVSSYRYVPDREESAA